MTAMAPSPTADATRLAESERTSPAANTPGTLVSRWYGSRSSGQPGRCSDWFRSGPDTMNPWPSRATTPSSQPVLGAAPMKMNSWLASTGSVAPVFRSRSTSCSR